MTRFLKRAKPTRGYCGGCAFHIPNADPGCFFVKNHSSINCGKGILILVPRPPDGTRCRDLDGNIKVVGREV